MLDFFILWCLVGNGIVEFPEFVDLMSRRPWGMQGSQQELDDAFRVFMVGNEEGDIYVSAAEVRNALTSLGEKLTDEEVDEMFKQMTIDGEGKVKYTGET